MRLSEAIEILARRLRGKRGRIAAIANRLQHSGLLPMADARRTPPEISPEEIAWLLLAVLAETGIESAAARTRDYGLMTSSGGHRLHDALAFVFRGQAEAGDIIVRDGGATATVNGQHVVFGNPAEDGPARFATGPTLAAIVAEWHGTPPHQADAVAAITRI